MDHIFESLLEYAGGTNRNDSVRLLANKPLEDGISLCIFELGGYEQMFVASIFKLGMGQELEPYGCVLDNLVDKRN